MNKPRGLAALSPERRREIASMGGKSAKVRAFDDPELARRAGKLGGAATRQKRLDNEADKADANE